MAKKILHVQASILRAVLVLAAWFLCISSMPVHAADRPPQVSYTYDQLGRVIGVRAASGSTASYRYDAVGNIASIGRTQGDQLALIGFTPGGGTAGASVTIYGSGFSTAAQDNQISFNGTQAVVVSVTGSQIVALVPAGATTGPLSLTTPAGTAHSAGSFLVAASQAPAISGFSPVIGTTGTAIVISGSNFDPSHVSNKISLNGRDAVAAAASRVSITTQVPPSIVDPHFEAATTG